jgi:hypothetical protein
MPSTWSGAPTLTDREILAFCATGVHALPGIIGEDTNRRAIAAIDANRDFEPCEILASRWLHYEVITHPAVAGAARSLLGAPLGLPVHLASHRRVDSGAVTCGWHVDGGSRAWGPEVHDLQVFYLPQETPRALGPTEYLPGSHLVRSAQRSMAHYGRIRGTAFFPQAAGSVILTMYRLWHRATTATERGRRDMYKFCYFRTAAPARDWIHEPAFDPARASFAGPAAVLGDQFHESFSCAEMFCWLSGWHRGFRTLGGQGWPVPGRRIADPYGLPPGLPRGAGQAAASGS